MAQNKTIKKIFVGLEFLVATSLAAGTMDCDRLLNRYNPPQKITREELDKENFLVKIETYGDSSGTKEFLGNTSKQILRPGHTYYMIAGFTSEDYTDKSFWDIELIDDPIEPKIRVIPKGKDLESGIARVPVENYSHHRAWYSVPDIEPKWEESITIKAGEYYWVKTQRPKVDNFLVVGFEPWYYMIHVIGFRIGDMKYE